jgi:hypothetical protein
MWRRGQKVGWGREESKQRRDKIFRREKTRSDRRKKKETGRPHLEFEKGAESPKVLQELSLRLQVHELEQELFVQAGSRELPQH